MVRFLIRVVREFHHLLKYHNNHQKFSRYNDNSVNSCQNTEKTLTAYLTEDGVINYQITSYKNLTYQYNHKKTID